jgi:hypothetical protein
MKLNELDDECWGHEILSEEGRGGPDRRKTKQKDDKKVERRVFEKTSS